MTIYNMDGAAKALLKSRRWLQDWLRDHPADDFGVPFYSPLGRTKTFDDKDLERDPERPGLRDMTMRHIRELAVAVGR